MRCHKKLASSLLACLFLPTGALATPTVLSGSRSVAAHAECNGVVDTQSGFLPTPLGDPETAVDAQAINGGISDAEASAVANPLPVGPGFRLETSTSIGNQFCGAAPMSAIANIVIEFELASASELTLVWFTELIFGDDDPGSASYELRDSLDNVILSDFYDGAGPNTSFVFATLGAGVYEVESNSESVTPFAFSDTRSRFMFLDLSFSAAPVPEPSPALLVLIGGAALCRWPRGATRELTRT